MQNGSLQNSRELELPLNKQKSTIPDYVQNNPLFAAVYAGDEHTVAKLLSTGTNRTIKDPVHGNTPLHEAAWRGYSRCVKILCTLPNQLIIENGGKRIQNGKNTQQSMPSQQRTILSGLLNTRNNGGFCALHLAAQNGHNQSCREILLAAADPNVQNNYGDTPMHTACRYGHAGATRILLSAKCDPIRVNLNGDTPLHIACAMGRRKLTRIILEAGYCQILQIKNAQNETAHEIAVRKNLFEIIEILDTPIISPIESNVKQKTKLKTKSKEVNIVPETAAATTTTTTTTPPATTATIQTAKQWSPYGCHYFPDPRVFPSPKLETLPKEPLNRGEQYYLDLAGNIRKGPVGVGNTCYCGPFFRHIEQRISQNKRNFKKYVQKETEKVDCKVQALASETNDKIEKIAKSMLSDHCSSQWLRRGHKLRATLALLNMKNEQNDYLDQSLVRSRSLESLDDENQLNRFDEIDSTIRRSCDLLDINNRHQVLVHHEMNDDIHPNGSFTTTSHSGSRHRSQEYEKRSASSKSGTRRIHTNNNSVQTVSKRLNELLNKTNEIIQMEQMVRQKYRERNEYKNRKTKERNRLKVFDENLLKICQDFDKYNGINNSNDNISNDMKHITNQLSSSISSNHSKSATSSSHRSIEPKITTPDCKIQSPNGATSKIDENCTRPMSSNSSTKFNQGESISSGFFQNTSFDPDASSLSSNTIQSVKINKCAVAINLAQSSNDQKIIDEIDGQFNVTELSSIKKIDEIKNRLFKEGLWNSDVMKKSLQFNNNFDEQTENDESDDESECSDDEQNDKNIYHNGHSMILDIQRPKDAYYHDLTQIKNEKKTDLPLLMHSIGRNRNPLPYTMNSDDEILADSQLPPLIMKNHIDNLDRTALTMHPSITTTTFDNHSIGTTFSLKNSNFLSSISKSNQNVPILASTTDHIFNRTQNTDNNSSNGFPICNRTRLTNESNDFMFSSNIGASSLV